MYNFETLKKPISAAVAILGLATLCAHFAAAETTVSHDGRFIYYHTSFAHMSKDQQKEVIDKSVELLKNEISSFATGQSDPATLSSSIIPNDKLDDLTTKAQQSVKTNGHGAQMFLPAGFFVYGGGTLGLTALIHGAIAPLDLGLVVVPVMVTRVDTLRGNKVSHYFDVTWDAIILPHFQLGAGIGTGPGVAGVLGAGLIFGDLNRAQDFNGVLGSFSPKASFIVGAGARFIGVRSRTGKLFGIAALEWTWGVEAKAVVDLEAGAIQPVGEWIDQNFGTPGLASGGAIIPGDPSVSVAAPDAVKLK